MSFKAVMFVPVVVTLADATGVNAAAKQARAWGNDQSIKVNDEIFYARLAALYAPHEVMAKYRSDLIPKLNQNNEAQSGTKTEPTPDGHSAA